VHALTHSEIARTETGRTRGPKILIVDDDPEVRSIVAEFLEDLGYDVLQARGGAQALDLQERTSNLRMIITDIRMPDMSGIELANLAAQRQKDLKIILISGYFVSQQVERRFPAQAVPYEGPGGGRAGGTRTCARNRQNRMMPIGVASRQM
jgi:CheY-like chemotaxis protein